MPTLLSLTTLMAPFSPAAAPSPGGGSGDDEAWFYFEDDDAPTPPVGATSLPRAIAARWDSLPDLAAAFPGGLWADLGPEGIATPFAVYFETSLDSSLRDSDGRIFELGLIDFTAYAAGKDGARDVGEVLFAAFDDADLPLANGRSILEFRRSGSFSLISGGKGPGSLDVWQCTQSFQFRLQR